MADPVSTEPNARFLKKDRAAGAWTNLEEEALDGGDGTMEPVVNVYTKLKDNKQCSLCKLWGRRRFFGDWEWREQAPRCKKCVKDTQAAKDSAKFGKRADFIQLNRTKSASIGLRNPLSPQTNEGEESDYFSESFSSPGSTSASPGRPFLSSVRRGIDASFKFTSQRNTGARRDTRGVGQSFKTDGYRYGDGLGADRSPPVASVSRISKQSRAYSATERKAPRAGARGGGRRDTRGTGHDWQAAYDGIAGSDPLSVARHIEASLPSRAQRVLDRAAILTGRDPGSSRGTVGGYRPTTVMSDAGPRGGRTIARRFDLQRKITATKRFDAPSMMMTRFGKGTEPTTHHTGSDSDESDTFVSRVPEVYRSTLYPGAGYVPVRERAASGGSAVSSFGAGRRVSGGYGFSSNRFDTASAPVTPLYQHNRGVSYVHQHSEGGFQASKQSQRDDNATPFQTMPAYGSASGSRPSSYVKGLMGKSGFGDTAVGVSRGVKAKESSDAPSQSPFTPRAPSHIASGASKGDVGEFKPLGLKITAPSQEVNQRLTMYGGGGLSSRARSQTADRKPQDTEFTTPNHSTSTRKRYPSLQIDAESHTATKQTPHRSDFEELRPTPLVANTSRGGSAAGTPFDAVPSALEALSMQDGSLGGGGEGVFPDDLGSDHNDDSEYFKSAVDSSPGAGLWFGSSAKKPLRAFRAVLDACALSEEDAFVYKNVRVGRFSLLDAGRSDFPEAKVYLRSFVESAFAKGMTPPWWTDTHTATVLKHAFDKTHALCVVDNNASSVVPPGAGESGKVRDKLIRRWGVAGTEALRDFHFDVAPDHWNTEDDSPADDSYPHGDNKITSDAITVFPTGGGGLGSESDVLRRVLETNDTTSAAVAPRDATETFVGVVAPGSRVTANEHNPTFVDVDLPTWEDADQVTRGVVVALRDRNALCAPLSLANGEGDGERESRAVDFDDKKAVVFLGVGHDSCDDLNDSNNIGLQFFSNSQRKIDALVAFVESGGVCAVQGLGHEVERLFGWFGLAWRFAGETLRGELSVNATCWAARAIEFSKNAMETEQNGYHAIKFDGITGVAAADRVFIRACETEMSPNQSRGDDFQRDFSEEASTKDPCPFAAARVGSGTVVFVGDRGGGNAVCEIVANLACAAKR